MSDSSDLLRDGPAGSDTTIVLAHGAGAPMDSSFMNRVAGGLAEAGIRVVRFEFEYMCKRRATGSRNPPDRGDVLRRRWIAVLDQIGDASRVVIGGKSMGGRIASMIADAVGARGLVCLGYPFHPPGQPHRLRVAHLAGLRTPTLIVQGSRDALGRREEIEGYDLSPAIRTCFLDDGDHSFKPRVRSGRTEEQNLEQAVQAVADFLLRDLPRAAPC